MAYPTDEQIGIRTHELWEQAGKPDGREGPSGNCTGMKN